MLSGCACRTNVGQQTESLSLGVSLSETSARKGGDESRAERNVSRL